MTGDTGEHMAQPHLSVKTLVVLKVDGVQAEVQERTQMFSGEVGPVP